MTKKASQRRPGLSRIAFLLLVAAAATAVGAIDYGVNRARNASFLAESMANLNSCAQAAHLCHDAFEKFPPYYGVFGAHKNPLTFHVHFLPFVASGPWCNDPIRYRDDVLDWYLSPMDGSQTNKGAGAANFVVNMRLYYTNGGVGQLSTPENVICPKLPESFPDGASSTLLLPVRDDRHALGNSPQPYYHLSL